MDNLTAPKALTSKLSHAYRIGTVLLQNGFAPEALPYLERALVEARDSFDANTIMNLGVCYRQLNRFEDAVLRLNQASYRMPDSPLVATNLGQLYEDLGLFAEALSAHQAAFRKSNVPQIALNLATCLMREGKFLEAWGLWEYGRTPNNWSYPNLPRWNGQDLRDKKILISREGGYGDVFLYMRWFRNLKELGASVHFWVWESAIPLLQGHPWIDELISAEEGVSLMTNEGQLRYDYHLPLMSLPAALKLEAPAHPLTYIGNLIVDPEGFGRIKTIGICWFAEENTVARKHRSVPFEAVAQLLGFSTPQWINWIELQPTDTPSLSHPIGPNSTWLDTAKAIETCDLVIAVDTAILQLASAMGKETWALLPKRLDWKWGTKEHPFHWYSNCRYFYQEDPIAWDSVIREVSEALRARNSQ